MTQYALAVGTHDPHRFAANSDADAIRQAVAHIQDRYRTDLDANPQEVATLLGPSGLVTRPSERIDEFVARVGAGGSATDDETVQPGDSNTPDCNGD